MTASDANDDHHVPPQHTRRPRYVGTHPRRFGEKYKELAPERYPEQTEHVRGRGRTPAGQHVPIMVEEVLAALSPKPGERGVDGTLGYGGHAQHLLAALAPGGRLLGLDVDPLELPKTEARLRALGHETDALIVRRSNFAGLGKALIQTGWNDGVDFLFVDLGVSSMQIDDPKRGFSFKVDGPLDMRMNPARGSSAGQWLASVSVEKLSGVLTENADEPQAALIAEALVARARSPEGVPGTTVELADAVRAALAHTVNENEAERSVRRVFQALRIQVNDELGALTRLLDQWPSWLRPGGRAAVLSFHSGEDRRVKASFRRGAREGVWAAVSEKIIRASPAEQRDNPRSSSAKLRWAQRA
jgi:16S rRNA (cytosine1402-N4)-methyltransferase